MGKHMTISDVLPGTHGHELTAWKREAAGQAETERKGGGVGGGGYKVQVAKNTVRCCGPIRWTYKMDL